MSELKLFRLQDTVAVIVPPMPMGVEKSLQNTIEKNLETVLAVRFLASEYTTSKSHGGRIDTLGLDETNSPVIIEYKRATNENVINQGLFYLDWLLDHKADFRWLVMEKLGPDLAAEIDWSSPRLICIAGDFSRYDEHAVRQIPRNIDLIRYRQFQPDLLALELVHRNSAATLPDEKVPTAKPAHGTTSSSGTDKSVSEAIAEMDASLRALHDGLRAYILALGDDVQEKPTKLYVTYRRIKIFASYYVKKRNILVFLKVNPDSVTIEKGFTRDVRNIGHWGIGDLEISIDSPEDLLKAQSLLQRSYEEA